MIQNNLKNKIKSEKYEKNNNKISHNCYELFYHNIPGGSCIFFSMHVNCEPHQQIFYPSIKK